jgi:hypothetical protein
VFAIESNQKYQRMLVAEKSRAQATANPLHHSRSLLPSMNACHKSELDSPRTSHAPLQHSKLDVYRSWDYVGPHDIYPEPWHITVLTRLVGPIRSLW